VLTKTTEFTRALFVIDEDRTNRVELTARPSHQHPPEGFSAPLDRLTSGTSYSTAHDPIAANIIPRALRPSPLTLV